jgi:hypothetical protein
VVGTALPDPRDTACILAARGFRWGELLEEPARCRRCGTRRLGSGMIDDGLINLGEGHGPSRRRRSEASALHGSGRDPPTSHWWAGVEVPTNTSAAHRVAHESGRRPLPFCPGLVGPGCVGACPLCTPAIGCDLVPVVTVRRGHGPIRTGAARPVVCRELAIDSSTSAGEPSRVRALTAATRQRAGTRGGILATERQLHGRTAASTDC